MIGFVFVNIQLFWHMEKKIRKLSEREANLKINVLSSRFILGNLEQQDEQFNINEIGLPVSNFIETSMEIENSGIEDGEFLWEIDYAKSSIPAPFKLYKNEKGYLAEELGKCGGRNCIKITWILPIQTDPSCKVERFAFLLRGVKHYEIVLKYFTKRIGGISSMKRIKLNGNFLEYKGDLISAWKRKDLMNLVNLVE